MKTFIKIILTALVIGILGLIYLISVEQLNNKEVMLISIILTILSILATWIASHYYSESSYKTAVKEVEEDHSSKLKTYALKASEKVNNLSTELNKLSLYLQEELDIEYENLPQENYSREERIKSAIHIIGTLKSVNDTALSDWKGVIGEELEEQEEEKKEREDALYDLIDRYEKLIIDMKDDSNRNFGTYNNENLRDEIIVLKKDLALLINNISGTTKVRSTPYVIKKQEVTNLCPVCRTTHKYRQRPKTNSFKIIHCKVCDNNLLSRWTEENGFILEKEVYTSEAIKCPNCETILNIKISSLPNSTAILKCDNCNCNIKVSRRINDLLTKLITPTPENPNTKNQITQIPSENIINLIKAELPKQPWPTGMHKEIAIKLNLTPKEVHLAINELINRGEYYPQFNGKIYQEIKD